MALLRLPMKVSYRLNRSISFCVATFPLILFLSVIIGAICALVLQVNPQFFALTLQNAELHFALGLSLTTSLCSLLLAGCIAIPIAWRMSIRPIYGQVLIDTLFDLPMVLPPLVTGLSLLLLLNGDGIVNQLFPRLGEWMFSPLGIIIAQTYVATAIFLRSARGAFSGLDIGYRLTAYNLGLSPFKTLLKVELPLCKKALICGGILAWSRAIGEFGATLMLAGATRFKTETLPMAVYLNIASGDFDIAIAAALWLLFIAGLLLFLLRYFNREKHAKSE